MKLILPIIFIIISVLAFIFGVNPLYKEVSILRSDISVYNSALSNSTNLQKVEDGLLKVYNEIKKEDKERLNNFLPKAINNIEFILEVERIANLHNMPVKDIKFESTRKANTTAAATNTVVSEVNIDKRPYGVFPLEFTTEGTYKKFVSFLKDLEYNLRLVDVKSISFSVPELSGVKGVEGVDPNIYRYTIKVETYWLK